MSDSQGLLHQIYEALEACRQELRALERTDSDHRAQLAVIETKIAAIEGQVQALQHAQTLLSTTAATREGKDNARWGILGAIGGAGLALVVWMIKNGGLG